MSGERESLIQCLRQKMAVPVWWMLTASLTLVYEGLRGLL